MASNLEIKVQISDPATIEELLARNLFVKDKLLVQKDIYYDAGSAGRLKIRIMPEHSEVIYYNRNEGAGERWSDYSLLRVNPVEAELFFDRLFPRLCIVQKQRRLYMYKDTRIHLDTVDNLGTFLELEAVDKGNRKEAKLQFEFLIAYLKLMSYPEIRGSYSDLMIMLNNSK